MGKEVCVPVLFYTIKSNVSSCLVNLVKHAELEPRCCLNELCRKRPVDKTQLLVHSPHRPLCSFLLMLMQSENHKQILSSPTL